LKRMPPKIVMGYSDVTTLHLFLTQKIGWVTFQGPMLSKDFADGQTAYDKSVLVRVLSPTASSCRIETDAVTLRRGTVEGVLLGGCLSLLVTSLGTPEEIDTRDAILLIEDIDEKPYRVDRMLFHLRRAGKFKELKGVVFGEMVGCGLNRSPFEDLRDLIQE